MDLMPPTPPTADAPSPYREDGWQWAWNSSTLKPAKQCWRKYYYEVRLGLASKSSKPDLVFGSHYAGALERYHELKYSEGFKYEHAQSAVVEETLAATADWQSDHTFKNRETLIRSVIWYLDEFKDDPCRTVLLSDGRPAVELPFQFAVSDNITFVGHLDRLVEYSGNVYVQDQKTTGSTIGSHYFKRYNPDVQMSLYSLAAEVVWKTPVAGVMIDAAQIAVGFTRFERGFTFRTKAQLQEWLKDTVYLINQQTEAERAGWPMNDSACMLYGGCPFIEVCSKDPRVRKNYLETGFEKRDTNPLRERRGKAMIRTPADAPANTER